MTQRHAVLLTAAIALSAPLARAAAAPVQRDPQANARALARIRGRIAGREAQPAESVFGNIEILRGKPASRLPVMMEALTGLIGVDCTYCHVRGDYASDDKPAKRVARAHFALIERINAETFGGRNKVSCWTCHRGEPKPPMSG